MEINRQNEDLKGRLNEQERENFNNINIMRRMESELNDLRNENGRLVGEINALHDDHNDRLQKMEKAKKSHMVLIHSFSIEFFFFF